MFEVSEIYDLRGWQVFHWLNRDSVIEIGNHELLNQHFFPMGSKPSVLSVRVGIFESLLTMALIK